MMVEGVLEGVGVGDFAAGGVEKPSAGFEVFEEFTVGEVAGGKGAGGFEGGVKGEDVGLGKEGVEREK